VTVNRAEADSALENGSFGWSGAFGTHFWADRKNQLAAVLLIQEPVNAMRGDFETAVIQALVE
jgi:CubicO group peptidase (beta-lactamase class C family)